MEKLPTEIIDNILSYSTFEQSVGISDYVTQKLFTLSMLSSKSFYKKINMSIIKWLCQNSNIDPDAWIYQTLNICAEAGKVQELKYIIEKFPDVYIVGALDRIPLCGDLAKVKWLYEQFPNVNPTRGAMRYAIRSKNVEVVEYIWNRDPGHQPKYKDLISLSVKHSSLELVKFFIENGVELKGIEFLDALSNYNAEIAIYLFKHHKNKKKEIRKIWKNQNSRIINLAVSCGSLELIKLLSGKNYEFDINAIMQAAKCGFLDIFKYLHEIGLPITEKAYIAACQNGHVDIIKYINDSTDLEIKNLTIDGMIKALEGDYMETVYYLFSLSRPNIKYNRTLALEVIKNGKLDFLKLLYDKGCEITSINITKEILEDMVERDYLDMFRYLFQEIRMQMPNETTETIFKMAMKYHRQNIIDWILYNFRDQLKKFSTDVIVTAAEYGYLDVLKMLHESNKSDELKKDIPFEALENAINQGYLEIAKWIHSKQKYSNLSCSVDNAVIKGYYNVIEWAQEEIGISYDNQSLFIAAECNHFDVVKLLFFIDEDEDDFSDTESVQSTAYKSKDIFDRAILSGNIEMLDWLIDNGAVPTGEAYCNVAKSGHYHLLDYLSGVDITFHNEIDNYATSAMLSASENRSFNIIKWLYENLYECFIDFVSDDVNEQVDTGDYYLSYIAEWLQFRKENEKKWKIAANAEDIETLRWLYKNKINGNPYMYTIQSINDNKFKSLDFFFNEIDNINNNKMNAMVYASIHNRFDIVSMIFDIYQKSLENRKQKKEEEPFCENFIELAVINAVINDKINLVQWLHKHGYKFTRSCINVMSTSNLSIAKWAYNELILKPTIADRDQVKDNEELIKTIAYFMEGIKKNTKPSVIEWAKSVGF